MESRNISVAIDRPDEAVYAFAADPANLPLWAAGLGSSIELVDGRWIAETSGGSVVVEFLPSNDFGILDHVVTLPNGERVLNPMRVIGYRDRSEVVFTLNRRPGMTDEEFESDAAAVAADLATLKRVLEQRPESPDRVRG
ncbi:SRPBCC family protein [Lacisediminihabitans profunda]|uniref:SRPBCC family protein n=1 Tax=Lacisediminihabitans profunda TaxID=2594790 RepID=A0A5C8UWY2_9MICO|nr:SRPBCC family protein [Lacisediminihabitans profunda]TXN32178.1 SRPBCC family protein [Lacisediminihabitans profunda]